jgi:hypothetical protein
VREGGMKKDGLQRMLDFLNFLNGKNIHFFIEQYAPEYLTVTLTLGGARVEVMFAPDAMTFSVFQGDESIESDEKLLHALIRERVE